MVGLYVSPSETSSGPDAGTPAFTTISPMTESHESKKEWILAIDIGATNIKFCHVDDHGQLLDAIRRRPTPYPCTPERLIELLAERTSVSEAQRIGIGFPGEFADGHVIRPGNLSRPGGIGTERDADLEERWRGFPLQEAMREATGRDVRVVNAATMAALGSCTGDGVELVFTLGTGFGLSLMVDGSWRRVRDVGAEAFRDGQTYDQLLGERSRAQDEDHWHQLLHEAVDRFVDEFSATTVHLAGGNARRVSPTLFDGSSYRVVIDGNQAPLHGAAKLFNT